MSDDIISGWPAEFWMLLFHDCHEFQTNGSYGKVKGRDNRVKTLGDYIRKEWPSPGGVFNQVNILVQAFDIIKDQLRSDQTIGIEIQV